MPLNNKNKQIRINIYNIVQSHYGGDHFNKDQIHSQFAQPAGAVEYADCTSAEG